MSNPIGSFGAAISLQRGDGGPLFLQIAAGIERLILAGALGQGVRLPAERDLAAELSVNRATVSRAYRSLEAKGLVASRVGSGTSVLAPAGSSRASTGAWSPPSFSRGIRELARSLGNGTAEAAEGAVDFARMFPDVELYSRRKLTEAVEAALEQGSTLLQYGSANGLPALREALAERARAQGIQVGAEQILVVNGIQQALDLIGKVLLEPGDAVVVESPTYANFLPLLRLYGAETIGVPLDTEGLASDPLERALKTHRPKLVYTIPSFHNPTGITMSEPRRNVVLQACRRAGALVVEDGYEEELRYWGEPLAPLMARAEPGTCVYLGTFSKGLFPGLRLGYLIAHGELLEMLTLAKRYTDYHADLLSQAVLVEILARGDYDRHLEKLRRTYRARLGQTLRCLERHVPKEVRWQAPEGGYTAWLELPAHVRASAVAEEARRRGVLVLAGGPFFDAVAEGESGLRLSISRTDPDRIEEGIAILGAILKEAIARERDPSAQPAGAPLI